MTIPKLSLPASLASFLLVLSLLTATAMGEGGSPVFDIPRLDGITIDGNPADWVAGDGRGFRIDQLADLRGEVQLRLDLDASVRLGWNERGLLVLVTVRDDFPLEADDIDKLWSRDGVELYLATGRGEKEVIQPIIAPGRTADHPDLRWYVHDHRKDKTLKETPVTLEAARTKTKDGYVLEALLPWSSLAIAPTVGREVGFQIYVNDVDEPDTRPQDIFHAVWYPKYGAFANTNAMHALRLSEKPSPPVRAAARVASPTVKGTPVLVIGGEDLLGQEAVLLAGEAELGRATFERKYGRAVADILVSGLKPGQAPSDMRVVVDGQTIATVPQRILPPPAAGEDEAFFGSRIPRTMTLLETSNSWRRNPVHIVLYGQSIVAGAWGKMLEADLRERFPYADLKFENRAIGGFEAHNLVRTAEADLYPAYPDLVIFHVYAGERTGETERMISNLRRYTTSEIMVFTHQAPLPNAQFDTSSDFWRRWAQEYNCELVDVREEWRTYIADNGLVPEDLLGGPQDVHPNEDGHRLIALLIGRHFRFQPYLPAGWADTVRTYEAKRLVHEGADDEVAFTGEPWALAPKLDNSYASPTSVVGASPDSALKLTFTGNRVDIVGGVIAGPVGTARVLIDGQPPSQNPRLYAFTRTTQAPMMWWPAIRRISHRAPLAVEDWTLRVTEISEKGDTFRYEVVGSVTGPDGEGSSEELFVSKSGRVVIEPRDFSLQHSVSVRGPEAKAPVGFEVKWKVIPLFQDAYTPPSVPEPELDAKGKEMRASADKRKNFAAYVHRTTVAQGLKNAEHTLEIIPNGDGPVPIESIIIHRPPLR